MIGCLNLADTCLQQGLHMTYFGTGKPALLQAELWLLQVLHLAG